MSRVTRTTKRRPMSRINAPPTAKNTVRGVQTPRSAMAIERVPIEIIDQIFEEYVEMDQSACNLTLVSRRWWSLAVANPLLWRYIVVRALKGGSCTGFHVLRDPLKELRHIGPSARIWAQGKAQVCNQDDDFIAAVNRSGSVPLHITYEGDSGTVLKRIFTAPISSRVAVLDIDRWQDMRPAMAEITLGPFTQLTELRSKMLQLIKYEEFIRRVQRSAPLLKTLEFHALTDPLLTLPIWKTLRTLEFHTISIEPQAFDSMLHRCHHLVKFSIECSMWPTMGTRLGPGALTNLETAKFNCDLRALSTLELVNIRSLTIIAEVEYGSTLGWQRIHLPKLAVLRIVFVRLIQGFKHLDAPLLQDLHITRKFPTISTEPQAFDTTLNRCHHLVKLSIGCSMWPTLGTSLGPGALTNLETAEFKCDLRVLSTLELVNIRSLDILEVLEDGNTLGWQRIHLPKLAMLRIVFTHSIQGFKHLDTPLLQDLHITHQCPFNAPNSELLEIFSSLSFPHLTHLYVKAHWDESVLTAIMSVIPNVRKINFIRESYHDRLVWESVLDKLLPVAGDEPFCPKLESCTLADEKYPAALRRLRLDYFIKAIQTYRKEHAMPKPRFEIYNHCRTSTKVERIEYN